MKRKLSVIAAICCLLPLYSFAEAPQMFTGEYTSINNKSKPFLGLLNPISHIWTYPNLPDISKDAISIYLSGSGCNSKFCAAVGSYHNENKYHPIVAVSYNHGNQWSYVPKFNENIPGELSHISCNSNLCVAVGEDQQHGFHPYLPLLTVSNGSEWSIPSSIINNLPTDFKEGNFGNVTCNDSFCMAAGEYDTKNGPVYPLIAVSTDKDKQQWTYSSSLANLFPKDIEISDVFSLTCTDKVCIISGLYRLPSDKQVAFLATSYDKGKTWTTPADINSKLPESDDSSLNKVNCYKDFCIAAGDYHPNIDRGVLNSVPLIAISHDTGKTWSYNKNLNNALPAGYKDARFWNVGCNEKICLAGGQLTTSNDSAFPFLMYSKDQGETWSMLKELPKDYQDGGSFTGGINCNETSCFAIGNYRNTAQAYVPALVTTQDGNTWSYPSSVIDNLPQDFMYTTFLHTNSHTNGLMAKKKHTA